jgi:hypothetical protein
MVKQRRLQSCVHQLKKENGEVISYPEEMRKIATNFYKNLLTADSWTIESERNRQNVWDCIPPMVSEMKERLQAQVTLSEIFETIYALPLHSCLGEDGITMSFFKKYLEVIKELLCCAFQEILDAG